MMFYEVLLFGSDKSRKKGNTVFEPTKLIMATQLSRFTQNSKKSHFEECFYFLKNPFSNCNYALCEKRRNSHAWKYLGVAVFEKSLPSDRKWEKWSQWRHPWSHWRVEEASEVPREIKSFQLIFKLDMKSMGSNNSLGNASMIFETEVGDRQTIFFNISVKSVKPILVTNVWDSLCWWQVLTFYIEKVSKS